MGHLLVAFPFVLSILETSGKVLLLHQEPHGAMSSVVLLVVLLLVKNSIDCFLPLCSLEL